MLLFLDIDGVLHPEPCYDTSQLFCRLPLLEKFLREVPQVDIVISSTWREKHSISELRGLFSRDITLRVVGVTPCWRDLPDLLDVVGYQRHVEIEGWRRANGRIFELWVALDDKSWLFKPFLPNLVICDAVTGIDDAALQQLYIKFIGGALG